jgi:hypothetical protein
MSFENSGTSPLPPVQTNYAKKTMVGTKLESVNYNEKFKKFKQDFDTFLGLGELKNMKM